MPYKPNYAMYSKPPQGWHDEPFEYCFSFAQFIAPLQITIPQQFDFFNNPLQLDPDADFYMRGISIVIDNTTSGEFLSILLFNMRLRDSYGRPLDNMFIPMQAYATNPGVTAKFREVVGAPTATPVYPELFCPANSAMWADFQAQTVAPGFAGISYSFHLYFQGIKRFQNEDCKPGTTTHQSKAAA